MRALALFAVFGATLVACGDDEFVCVDRIEASDTMAGLASRDDFIGIDTCYYAFADPKGCEDDGGTPYVMDEDYGDEVTCPDQGFGVRCGSSVYVQSADDCPEDYGITEL